MTPSEQAGERTLAGRLGYWLWRCFRVAIVVCAAGIAPYGPPPEPPPPPKIEARSEDGEHEDEEP